MATFNIITNSRGKAGEYAELSLNTATGCIHGCKYCYCPQVLHKTKDEFHNNIVLKKDFIERFEMDCLKLQKDGYKGRVHLSFATDPYQPDERVMNQTKLAIIYMDLYNINFQILTKGGTRACKDFKLYKPGDAFACTITTLDDEKAKIWEPQAALPSNRLEALKQAHSLGIETWISLEPVIWPEDSLAIIEATHEFVGHYKIGPLNYNKQIREAIDWKAFTSSAVALLVKYGKPYYIKEDLLKLIQ